MAMSWHIIKTCSGIFQLIDSISLIFQHFHGQRKKQRKKHTQVEKVREQKKRKKEIISIANSRNIAYTDPSSNFFGCLCPYFLKNIYRASHDFKMLKSDLYLRQLIIRCNQLEVFCKIHRKHLWWSLFFNKVAALSFNLCYQSACWLNLFLWT